jgi:hypothetical protein
MTMIARRCPRGRRTCPFSSSNVQKLSESAKKCPRGRSGDRCPRGRSRDRRSRGRSPSDPTCGLWSIARPKSTRSTCSHLQECTTAVPKSTTACDGCSRRFQPLGAPAAIPTFCRCMIGVRAGASVDRSACKAPAQTRRRPSVRARGDAENRVLACAKLARAK